MVSNADRDERISPQLVAEATDSPAKYVTRFWPKIVEALALYEIGEKLVQIAAIAIVAARCRDFCPVDQRGSADEFEKLYSRRKDLGNTSPGDNARYHGRGFVELLGRREYTHFASLLGIDLVGHPEVALEPEVAAKILAAFFHDYHLADYARERQWQKVYLRVCHTRADYDHYIAVVERLLAMTGE